MYAGGKSELWKRKRVCLGPRVGCQGFTRHMCNAVAALNSLTMRKGQEEFEFIP